MGDDVGLAEDPPQGQTSNHILLTLRRFLFFRTLRAKLTAILTVFAVILLLLMHTVVLTAIRSQERDAAVLSYAFERQNMQDVPAPKQRDRKSVV